MRARSGGRRRRARAGPDGEGGGASRARGPGGPGQARVGPAPRRRPIPPARGSDAAGSAGVADPRRGSDARRRVRRAVPPFSAAATDTGPWLRRGGVGWRFCRAELGAARHARPRPAPAIVRGARRVTICQRITVRRPSRSGRGATSSAGCWHSARTNFGPLIFAVQKVEGSLRML